MSLPDSVYVRRARELTQLAQCAPSSLDRSHCGKSEREDPADNCMQRTAFSRDKVDAFVSNYFETKVAVVAGARAAAVLRRRHVRGRTPTPGPEQAVMSRGAGNVREACSRRGWHHGSPSEHPRDRGARGEQSTAVERRCEVWHCSCGSQASREDLQMYWILHFPYRLRSLSSLRDAS